MKCDSTCGITFGRQGVVHTGDCPTPEEVVNSLKRTVQAKDEIIASKMAEINSLKVKLYDYMTEDSEYGD